MDFLRIKNISAVVLIFFSINMVGQSELKKAFELSLIHEAKANFKEAAKVLKSHCTDQSYEVNLRMGWLMYNDSNYKASLTYYTKAVALMPYAVEPKMGLVYPLSALNKWNEVEATYLEILSIMPTNTLVLYRMGLINYNRKLFDVAYKYLEKVVNLYPTDYDSMILFAWTNYQMGKFREANVLFNKVLMLYPNNISATEGLALIKK